MGHGFQEVSQQPAEAAGHLVRRLRQGRRRTATPVRAQPARFRKWPWIVLGLLFGSPLPVTGIVVIIYRVGISRAAAELPAETAKAKSDGMRFAIEDIRRDAFVDPSRNGADLYRKAFEGIDAVEHENERASKGHSGLDHYPFSNDMQALVDASDPTGALVADIEKAAQSFGVDWRRSWDGSEDTSNPEEAHLALMIGFLSGVAMIEARKGAIDKALGHIENAFRIAEHVGQEPLSTAQGVRASLDGRIFRAIGFILDQKPGLAALARIRSIIAGLPPVRDLRTSLNYALAESLRYIDSDGNEFKMRSGTQEAWTRDFPGNILYEYPTYWNAQRAKAIHYARLQYEAYQPGVSFQDASNASDRISELAEADRSKANQDVRYLGLPAGTFDDAVMRRLMLLSIDLLIDRTRTGKLPPALPKVEGSLDLYSNKPFIYKPHGAGFEIYSVGDNGKDDSAVARRHKVQDIVFDFK
jgi:hypothetical protein